MTVTIVYRKQKIKLFSFTNKNFVDCTSYHQSIVLDTNHKFITFGAWNDVVFHLDTRHFFHAWVISAVVRWSSVAKWFVDSGWYFVWSSSPSMSWHCCKVKLYLFTSATDLIWIGLAEERPTMFSNAWPKNKFFLKYHTLDPAIIKESLSMSYTFVA